MAFKHKLVSDLSKPSEHDLHNQSQSADYPWKLDGIPVRREVYDLGTELRRSFKGYRFHAAECMGNHIVRITYKDGMEKHCYADVQVYIEGSDYVVGRIGYGTTYGLKKADKPVYMIHSRKIRNDKFSPVREQYHMSFVGDLKRAVKLSLTKLTPYSPKEMANITMYGFKVHIEGVRRGVRDSVLGLLSPLHNHDILKLEMRNLIAQNTVFVTEEFQRAAARFIEAEEEWNKVRNKPIHGYYLYVRMVGDEQWVDIVEVTDAQDCRTVDHCPVMSTPVSNVPEDIQGKVAVLSMADRGQYMQGVGMRVSDKAFWLER